MPEEQQESRSIVAAVDGTDWARYAGQASEVRRRGERRRRRFQAGAGVGTTLAVVGVVFAANGLGQGSVTRQGAAPAAETTSSAQAAPTTPTTPTTGASGTPAASDYPTFPTTMPTTPLLVADGSKVLQSGVVGAGTVSGHQWQLSYRVIPSGSAANSQPQVTGLNLSVDGKTTALSYDEGTKLGNQGYEVVSQYLPATSAPSPIVVGYGSLSPSATSVDLRWANGTVVQVPVQTATGTRFAAFAWDPANPPQALEQVGSSGVQPIKITHDLTGMWVAETQKKTAVTPAATPAPTTPSGPANLSQTPHVTPIASGILGSGTIAGHTWQRAWEVIPSGSAANASDEVYCTDTTVDGKTQQDGCTSAKPTSTNLFQFHVMVGHEPAPFPIGSGNADPGTTAVGLEWADGTTTTTVTSQVQGRPTAALAFDPANPPKYLLEFGSYGEYRIPLSGGSSYSWTFNW